MTLSNYPVVILTCKHLKERRRRLWHTIWEITSGVLVFVMLLLMRQVIKHSHFTQKNGADARLGEIIFSPNNEIMQNFMMDVSNNLGTKRGSTRAGLGPIRGFYNEAAVQEYVKLLNNSSPVAVVNFKDVNTTLPNLDYNIKLVDKTQYKLHKPKLKRIPIHELLDTQEYASLPLMKLQWAIDRTFMERVSGSNISHRVEVPHFRADADSKTPMAIIHQFLIFCTVAAPLPFFLYYSSRLINERRCGLKELMKIVGVSPNELRLSHVMATAVLSTIYASLITIMLKATSTPILPHSNAFIIAWTIIMHFMNVTSLAFVTTSLSQSYEHANGLALVVYIVSCVLCKIWYNTCHNSVQVYFVSWFLPHAPVYLFWDEVQYLENIGEGVTFGGIASQHTSTCIPVLMSWTVFLVQQVFIMTLAWYLDMVNPGNYGVAQEWNFLFKKQYWTKKRRVTFHVTVEQTRRLLRDDRFFEKGPMNSPIVIKLTKVTKIFGGGFKQPKVVALDKISLDVYEGEITVVLGINGAGKTTLMSIVTGMTSATKGKVYVNGFDNTARIREIRKNLGLCPQQNLTFDYLTVRENIMLFERLRGPKCEVRASAENLIKKLHLEDKADLFSYQLSTSGERCLQVACALAGGADVLVLDEPTSNCDAETRSDLWDVILVLRGDKTVLMTTTSIEEADALGDRIALLSHGKLKCYGTPMFLKNAIGTGFNLSVTLKHKRNMKSVCQVINVTLPEATTTKIDHKRIIFTLPSKEHERFPKLFDILEERKDELGIAAMGVGMSLEEMFLGFIDEEDDEDPLFIKTFHDVERLKGWPLRFQQLKILIRRNFFRMWSFKYQFIILQIMVPVFGLIVITVTLNSSSIFENKPEIDIDHFDTLVLRHAAKRSEDLNQFRWYHPGMKIIRSRKVSEGFTNHANGHENSLLQNVIGIDMDDNVSSIYFPVKTQNDALKALNVFSNVYMSSNMPNHYSPIRTMAGNTTKVELFMPKENILCLLWAMWVTIIITLPLTPFIGMLTSEYKTTIRYTHFVVGCPFCLHWVAKLASHTIVFLAIIPLTVFLCAKFLDTESTFTQSGFLGAIFIAQLLFLPAFLLQLYVLSFFLNEESAMSQVYIMSIALGFSGPLIQIMLVHLSEESNSYAHAMQFFTAIGRFSPVFTLSELIAKFGSTARVKAYCSKNEHYCNYLTSDDYKSVTLKAICCGSNKEVFGYFSSFDSFPEVFTLICHSILYSILLVEAQNRCIQNVFARIFNCKYKESPQIYADLNVYHEKATVKRMMTCIKSPEHCIGDPPPPRVLLVDDLHKNYVSLCQSGSMNAVRGVSFSVQGGESLALLGPPGSGKTSTLRIIAGWQSVTKGDCYLDGCFLKKQRSKYIKKVSLIRCTGGLDEFYTGYENLKMLCMLHGYDRSQAETFTVNFMGYMGLQQLTHTAVRSYSAGCARRLSLCAALLAAPSAVLLDEPMRSVDPHSRPLVTRALARLTSGGCALVVAEQSINWRDVDSICSRIAVFTNGRIAALGPSKHVRAMIADGHTARLKLKLKPIRISISVKSTVEIISEEEVAKNEEAKRMRKKKRRLAVLSSLSSLKDDDDQIDDSDIHTTKGTSREGVRHDQRNTDQSESSSSRTIDFGTHSQQAARDQRRHYLTSNHASLDAEDEDDVSEDVKKVFRKSRYNFIRRHSDEDDEDSNQAEIPQASGTQANDVQSNSDRSTNDGREISQPRTTQVESVDQVESAEQAGSAQSGSNQADVALLERVRNTSTEIEISEPANVQPETVDGEKDQAGTDKPSSSQADGTQSDQTTGNQEPETVDGEKDQAGTDKPSSSQADGTQSDQTTGNQEPETVDGEKDQAGTDKPSSSQADGTQSDQTTGNQEPETVDGEKDQAGTDKPSSSQADGTQSDQTQVTGNQAQVTQSENAQVENVESKRARVGSSQADSTQSSKSQSMGSQAVISQHESSHAESVESARTKQDQPVDSRMVDAERSNYTRSQKTAKKEINQPKGSLAIINDVAAEADLASYLKARDDSNIRFLKENNLKGTVYADLARETMNRNVISLSLVQALKTDFKNEFPTSKLADEHLSMLHFHIRRDDTMPYSTMFSKLERLKKKYEDILEDYTLSEISIEDVYTLLARETT